MEARFACGSMVLLSLLHEKSAQGANFSCKRMSSSALPEAISTFGVGTA
jgi:hypothetical protein